MIFFISDTHLNHDKMIKYEDLPFENTEHMFDVIKTNWNNVVKSTDTVYVIGDFALGGVNKVKLLLEQLNGIIILIKGNHDDKRVFKLFNECYDYKSIQYKHNDVQYQICLMHYPIEEWDRKHYGSIHIHGHSHGKTPSNNIKRKDVCCKLINFTPISIVDVINEFSLIEVANVR